MSPFGPCCHPPFTGQCRAISGGCNLLLGWPGATDVGGLANWGDASCPTPPAPDPYPSHTDYLGAIAAFTGYDITSIAWQNMILGQPTTNALKCADADYPEGQIGYADASKGDNYLSAPFNSVITQSFEGETFFPTWWSGATVTAGAFSILRLPSASSMFSWRQLTCNNPNQVCSCDLQVWIGELQPNIAVSGVILVWDWQYLADTPTSLADLGTPTSCTNATYASGARISIPLPDSALAGLPSALPLNNLTDWPPNTGCWIAAAVFLAGGTCASYSIPA